MLARGVVAVCRTMMKQNILGMSEEEEQGQTDIEFDSRTLGTGGMCASPT